MSKILIKTQTNKEKQKFLEIQEKTLGINIKANCHIPGNDVKNLLG